MAVNPIEFGENLRPSTVTVIKKINEMIPVLNSLDPGDISQIEQDVNTLKGQMSTANSNISTLQTQMGTANTNINNLQSTTTSLTSDMGDVKTTLYTPLSESE